MRDGDGDGLLIGLQMGPMDAWWWKHDIPTAMLGLGWAGRLKHYTDNFQCCGSADFVFGWGFVEVEKIVRIESKRCELVHCSLWFALLVRFATTGN